MHLTGTDLLDCIALRRVRGGGVALHGSVHLDRGRRMPCYLPAAFRRLTEAVLTALLSPDWSGGPRRVVLTPRGQARYQELTAERDPYTDPEQSSGACSVPLAGCQPDCGRSGANDSTSAPTSVAQVPH